MSSEKKRLTAHARLQILVVAETFGEDSVKRSHQVEINRCWSTMQSDYSHYSSQSNNKTTNVKESGGNPAISQLSVAASS